jgi:hypothetical protein
MLPMGAAPKPKAVNSRVRPAWVAKVRMGRRAGMGEL